jgi:outer membrane protein OmpU
MKEVLLATTALVMTASLAAAEVSLSGRAGAGVANTAAAGTNGIGTADDPATVGVNEDDGVTSMVWSGIDLNVSASATTDGGVTISVSDDFGGGFLPDYADKEIDEQTSNLDTPLVTVGAGGWTVGFDSEAIDDRYDDDLNSGDISIDGSVGGLSVGITYDTEPAAADPGTSYALGYTMGDIGLSVTGTDNVNGEAAMAYTASYSMGDMTLSLASDNNAAADDVTDFTIAYNMGDISMSISADDANDWEASASYSAGDISVSYATDEESAWEADISYSLGSGASVIAATDSTEFSVVGIEFTF